MSKKSAFRDFLKEYGGAIIFLAVFIGFFYLFARTMGLANMLNTMLNTAYDLLMNTVFYLMAIAVVVGAVSAMLIEFGVVKLINLLLSPLMKPLYGMPGAASLGLLTTYLSDNPAILTLANDNAYRRYFRKYQIPALTNLGTSFGMGLIVSTFILGIGERICPDAGLAVICGNLGAVAGSIVSTRLMLHSTAKAMGREEFAAPLEESSETEEKKTNVGLRLLRAMTEGGKNGVELGLGIIPGVLVVCTVVSMLTNGPSADGTYTGAAKEGIMLLPMLASKLRFILQPLFGFASDACIAVPITALGSAGAALGMIDSLIQNGMAVANDVAVFTAICMCWSGYLSTHVAMMDMLKCSDYTGKAILYHTLGGIVAGVVAHWLFVLLTLF